MSTYTFDGPNRIIILSQGSTSLDVRLLWSEWVNWYLLSDHSKFLQACSCVGGQEVTSLTRIPIYIFLENGWRIRPQESNHTLEVVNGFLVVSGGGDPFINTQGPFTVRVNYQQPVQAIAYNSTSIDPAALSARLQILEKVLCNKTILDKSTGLMTLFDDDNVSTLMTAEVYEDEGATKPYRGGPVQRREKLTP